MPYNYHSLYVQNKVRGPIIKERDPYHLFFSGKGLFKSIKKLHIRSMIFIFKTHKLNITELNHSIIAIAQRPHWTEPAQMPLRFLIIQKRIPLIQDALLQLRLPRRLNRRGYSSRVRQ